MEDWRCASSYAVLACQAQGPEFKPQYQPTNKHKLEWKAVNLSGVILGHVFIQIMGYANYY
jgi:hypothetical protein